MRPEEIFSSSYAAAAYLSSIHFKKTAYVVGEAGILEELDQVGVTHLGGPADAAKKVSERILVLPPCNFAPAFHSRGASSRSPASRDVTGARLCPLFFLKVELKPGAFMEHDPDVGAVIVGFDRNINYYKIQASALKAVGGVGGPACLRPGPDRPPKCARTRMKPVPCPQVLSV